MSKYREHNPRELGEYYTTHIMAMTAENLYDKSAIAAELAYRDKRIAELEAELAGYTNLLAAAVNKQIHLNTENQRLRDALANLNHAIDELREGHDALVVALCDRWINCDDALPKQSGRYLAVLSSGIGNETHGITIEYFEATKSLNKFHTHRHTVVTHWMDLPPMPRFSEDKA